MIDDKTAKEHTLLSPQMVSLRKQCCVDEGVFVDCGDEEREEKKKNCAESC